MAAKSKQFAGDLLRLILNGTPIPGLADNAALDTVTTLHVGLHKTDPAGTPGANQASGEVAYGGYVRVPVARSEGGWTVTGTTASPSAAITFPVGTSGSDVAYFASVGTGAAGPTPLLYSAPLAPPIPCGSGIAPQILTSARIVEQ